MDMIWKGREIMINEIITDLETEVFKAIEDAAGHSACSLAYVKGILEKKGAKKASEPKLKRVGEK